MAAASAPTLSPEHPLIAELTALRQQLAQYQRSAHQSAIQVQAGRLELELARGEVVGLRDTCEALKREVDVLRTTPDPPSEPPASNALTELSLAHRRLSTKLDLTENQLAATQLELAQAKQELHRVLREREGDRTTISELRRVEEDRLEEIEWERGERRKAEEQKKLCDLALAEYKQMVQHLDPNAVPPATPESSTDMLSLSLSRPPSPPATASSPAASASSSSEAISHLLIGQRGVHQLFHDFTATLAAKERTAHALEAELESAGHSLAAVRAQLAAETASRVAAEAARDRAVRDDASAASVVERYMTFSQKSHQTIHRHLSQLRARAAATQASLRREVEQLAGKVRVEAERCETLRRAAEETGAELSREAAGRRREVALRLKMIADEERRARRIEGWTDRVRRAPRDSDAAALLALLDEGTRLLGGHVDKEEARGWRRLMRRKSDAQPPNGHDDVAKADSVARVLHAEELVVTLVQDLQMETERRVELERQRVEWLAREAAGGVSADHADGRDAVDDHAHLVFDAGDDDDAPHATETLTLLDGSADGRADAIADEPEKAILHVEQPDAAPAPSPLVTELHALFDELEGRFRPLQKTLHDQAAALATMRPDAARDGASAASGSAKRAAFLPLARARATNQLVAVLDGLHEVIEDARVDVEIALADEERVCHGFEALLGVGHAAHDAAAAQSPTGTSGAAGRTGGKSKADVMRDARAYAAGRADGDMFERLRRRVDDIDLDLALVKRTMHEVDGLDEADDDEGEPAGGASRRKSVWAALELRTVSTPASDREGGPDGGAARKRPGGAAGALLSNVGRSFSSGMMSTPRRVSGLATGFVKVKDRRERAGEDDDVE